MFREHTFKLGIERRTVKPTTKEWIENRFGGRGRRKGIRILLLWLAAVPFFALARGDQRVAEGLYTGTVYRLLSAVFGFLSSLIPVSLSELFILVFPAFLIWRMIRFALALRRKAFSWKAGLKRAGFVLAFTVSLVFFLFQLFCAPNYNRRTFAQLHGLTVRPSSKEALFQLCKELAAETNALRERLPEDEQGVMVSGFDSPYETAKYAQIYYDELGRQYPLLGGYTVRPKPVGISAGMSYGNITGIYNPFFFEANVNVDTDDDVIPASMMHELSHYKGFMREGEANFIAYLACHFSGNDEFDYSGSLLALQYSVNALYRSNPDEAGEILSSLSAGVQRDRQANRAYWSAFQTPVAETSRKINDLYLKSNSQAQGVQSYGEMVDLLLAMREAGGF